MTTPLSEIEAPEADYLIWWTNQEDCRRVEELGAAGLLDLWPKYLHGQYESRSGRAGRGRLWVDDSFPVRGAAWNDGAPFCKIAADAAGIVIKAHDVWHVIALPGFITTVDMTVYASDLLQQVRALTNQDWQHWHKLVESIPDYEWPSPDIYGERKKSDLVSFAEKLVKAHIALAAVTQDSGEGA